MNNATQHLSIYYTSGIRDMLMPDNTTEIVMNSYGNALRETAGKWEPLPAEHFTPEIIDPMFLAINSYSRGNLSDQMPLLYANLPTGERITLVQPPATEREPAFSLRKPGAQEIDLDTFEKMGAFDDIGKKTRPSRTSYHLDDMSVKDFLIACVKDKQTIVVSGGTSTGKTTFCNALVKHIPKHERIITIEDAREINLTQTNKLHLLAQRNSKSHGYTQLLEACLRLRPDRILAAELRGTEAFTFLQLVNTGHPGSMTTLHANDCEGAIHRLVNLLKHAGVKDDNQDLYDSVTRNIDIIIQLDRNQHGKRYISELWFRGELIKPKSITLRKNNQSSLENIL